jgi:hypothetical protein
MRFLVVGKCIEEVHCKEFQNLQEAEGKALWELYGAGVLQMALFGKQMGCLSFIFECRNVSEAQQFLQTLPSVKAEVIDYQISELTPLYSLTEQFMRHHSKMPNSAF